MAGGDAEEKSRWRRGWLRVKNKSAERGLRVLLLFSRLKGVAGRCRFVRNQETGREKKKGEVKIWGRVYAAVSTFF